MPKVNASDVKYACADRSPKEQTISLQPSFKINNRFKTMQSIKYNLPLVIAFPQSNIEPRWKLCYYHPYAESMLVIGISAGSASLTVSTCSSTQPKKQGLPS